MFGIHPIPTDPNPTRERGTGHLGRLDDETLSLAHASGWDGVAEDVPRSRVGLGLSLAHAF